MSKSFKKKLKRFIASLLLITICSINFSPLVFAKTNYNSQVNNSLQSEVIRSATIDNANLNTKQQKLLAEENVDLSEIQVVDKNLILSDEALQKLKEEDSLLESQGITIESEVYYIKKDSKALNNNLMATSSVPDKYDMIMYRTRQLTPPAEDLTDNTTGIKTLLDITWNVVIGVKTKYFWIAATVLGLNPSNFFSKYQQGDVLRKSETFVYNDKYYCYFDENNDYWPVLRTSQLNLSVWLDLITHTTDGLPYRDSGVTSGTFYTEHYYDQEWIETECYVNWSMWKGLSVTYDQID